MAGTSKKRRDFDAGNALEACHAETYGDGPLAPAARSYLAMAVPVPTLK